MGFFIPDTMKKFNNWVVWSKEGDGNYKKVPYDPRTGCRANPTKSCCNYNDALLFFEYGGEYDGIGFTFTNGCGLTFIDLDNCIDDNGNESLLAEELQELFKDSYIELSQSEKGLHIVCIGTIPRTIKTNEIEIYSSGRYMAMTGNTTNAHEPQEAQKQLNLIFDRYKTEKAENEPQNEPQGYTYECGQDVQALIEIISHSRQGEKWLKLHKGNIEGYQSRSEAMLAYIAITNYYAGGQNTLIKAVFKQSGFPEDDPKYNNEYYINRAIRKAQETVTGCHIEHTPIRRTTIGNPIKSRSKDHTEHRRRHF